MTKIVAFSGSARKGSLNKKLVHAAVHALREAGAEVDEIDLRDYPMPLYDGDLEEAEGQPENAGRLREKLAAADGLLVGCPEYNGLITPLLKNTIDWISRPDPDGNPGTAAVRGKVAALTAASPGGLGGLRGLPHVRTLLSNIGMVVIPDQVSLPQAHKAIDENGHVTDESVARRIDQVARECVRVAERLKG
jgi:NAD(P)H-dependent FMN reductase